jgi:post-segregation antitoxin (ccd killing protein)
MKDLTVGERVTIEVDPEALAAARAAGIDLSQLLAEALRRRLAKSRCGHARGGRTQVVRGK